MQSPPSAWPSEPRSVEQRNVTYTTAFSIQFLFASRDANPSSLLVLDCVRQDGECKSVHHALNLHAVVCKNRTERFLPGWYLFLFVPISRLSRFRNHIRERQYASRGLPGKIDDVTKSYGEIICRNWTCKPQIPRQTAIGAANPSFVFLWLL